MAPRSSYARNSSVAPYDVSVLGAPRAETELRWPGGTGAENDDRARASAETPLSALQCETAEYIADMTASLADMSRLNGLSTLAALLGVIAREADNIGRTNLAA